MYSYKYPRAALTVDAIVIARQEGGPQLLLIKRGNEPFKNMWALPGGFIGMEETLEVSCKRELQEETGLEVKKLTQFKAFSAINRDPRHRTISVVFFTFINNIVDVNGMDDASDARWFPIKNIPATGFDHGEIIKEFITWQGI